MADEASVEVRGLDEAARDIGRVVDRIDEASAQVIDRAADRVHSVTATQVPRRTGNLAASLETLAVVGGAAVGYDTGRAPYAGWIEFGGSRSRAYVPEGRYLFPTGQESTTVIVAQLEERTSAEIRGFPWSKAK